MNHEYKNSGRDTRTERESRAGTAVEIRNQRRNDMLQKRRTMSMSRGPEGYSISEFAEKINSRDPERIIEGVTEFRRLLSAEKSPPISVVVENGLVATFTKLIDFNNPIYRGISEEQSIRIIHEAAWVLTNIASGTHEQTMFILKAGAIIPLIALLNVNNVILQDQAAWAIGNIAGDGELARDALIGAGLTDPLVNLIDSILYSGESTLPMLKNLVWTLSNTCRGRNPPAHPEHLDKALGILVKLVDLQDADILTDTYWAISYVCDSGINYGDKVLAAGLIEKIVALLRSFVESVPSRETPLKSIREKAIIPLLRTIGNLLTYEDPQTDCVLQMNILPILKQLYFIPLDHKKAAKTKKEICWILSNITAGNPSQIDLVINEGFLEILINAINSSDQLIKIEACWALCNASVHIDTHPNQTKEVIRAGAPDAFGKFLSFVKSDTRIITVILNAITNFLEYGKMESLGGENTVATEIENGPLLDQIEELQTLKHAGIAAKAEHIIREYFNGY
ncbi:importin subunit alpha-6/7 [Nematocida sp. LUAm3]|nr:importin subunit alpha-6/7 [Nematocida sp. LUAm3]KAI5174517.1 importin subunit alpha-6/7 [Nematocida sp. LUAm2]KAI5179168.1 importin subunit alpha-6/7 [Nematocida sp. LUAm1]